MMIFRLALVSLLVTPLASASAAEHRASPAAPAPSPAAVTSPATATAAKSGDAAPQPIGSPLYKATSRRSFDDVAYWSGVFDDPARDAWQKPAELVAALDLRPGMTVADLGAGTGYFSRHLSAAVGATGTVFAVETEPNMVAKLRERSKHEQTANVTPVLASFDNPRLPPRAIDLVLIVDTFHHIDDRLPYLRRLAAVLTPEGRVAIVDWEKRDLPVGPPPDHKIAREQVVAEMESAGYVLRAAPAVLPYQYFLIFAPS
jgi:predicted methyltransferase